MEIPVPQESATSTEVYRHVDTERFYRTFFSKGLRPDGRTLLSYRRITVEDLLKCKSTRLKLSLTNGIIISSVRVSVGNTHVHCMINAAPFYDNKPKTLPELCKDLINVSLTIPKHVTNEVYDINGPCINISHIISNLIENCFNSSNVLPKEQLLLDKLIGAGVDDPLSSHIKKNKLRWKLNFNITCEEYDGNILDASILSVTYAVKRAKLPILIIKYDENLNTYQPSLLAKESDLDADKQVEINKSFIEAQIMNKNVTSTLDNEHFSSLFYHVKGLEILSLPYTVTFCKHGEFVLLDPTREEEQIGVNLTIYCLNKTNGMDLDEEILSLHPLNIMVFTDSIEESYYKIARDIVKHIKTIF